MRALSLLILLFTASLIPADDAAQLGGTHDRSAPGARGHGYAPGEVPRETKRLDRGAYGNFPLSFEVNRGQTDPQVKFLVRGPHHIIFLTAAETVLVLTQREPPARGPLARGKLARRIAATGTVLRMAFVGASPVPQVVGETELPGKANYFIGNVPAKWRTNVPTYARVRYRNLYPGIDLIYYGNRGHLEYDFVVRPGADPTRIALRWRGAGGVKVDARGDLVLRAPVGVLRHRKPVIYQEVGGARRAIPGGYALKDAHTVGFRVGAYDAARPLVIDPVLSYSTYLGGNYDDWGQGIAVDTSGKAYVTGETESTDFPTVNALQTVLRAVDAFVAKVDATGSRLLYSTYLGGSSSDAGTAIAVDAAGNAYVTGWTTSSDFPTVNAFQPHLGGMNAVNAFVAMVSATDSQLVYSSYLGGSGLDMGSGIAVNAAGNAYVTGFAGSADFPTTVNAFQRVRRGPTNAFVAKMNATGSQLLYSTYLGGSGGGDWGNGIAVDAAGNAYVTGLTSSSNFPTTANALQPHIGGVNGPVNGFVTKVNAAGSGLVYSTFLGGSTNWDAGQRIAVDATGNAYVTGYANSSDFPTVNPLQSYRPGTDAFVAKVNTAGSALLYSTYLGGSYAGDGGSGIAVDAAGNAYVTGNTSASDFPTVNALQPVLRGQMNAFVVKVNATGSALLYSTYLGGSGGGGDWGTGIAVDALGNAYVTGNTSSSDFPTVNAVQPTYRASQYNAFVAKIASLLVYRFQGTASGNVLVSPRRTYFSNRPFTLTVTANPDAIVQFTQACAVPSGTCTLFAVQATSATISFPATLGITFPATITLPVGVFVNQTWQTLGFSRMAAGRPANDLLDLQSNSAFGTYKLANALGPVGPFFTTTTTLAQFNCNFGCVMTNLGILTVSSVSNVTFTAE